MLQVIDINATMYELMTGKKDAKKLKKTLYIYPKKDQDIPRCLLKAQSKKDEKNH
jgi:hypothetical protein